MGSTIDGGCPADDGHGWNEHCDDVDDRSKGLHLVGRDIREGRRHGVLAGVTPFEMRRGHVCGVVMLVGAGRMRVRGESVVMLRMIVPAVGMNVLQRRHAGEHDQRNSHDGRGEAVHAVESMGPAPPGQIAEVLQVLSRVEPKAWPVDRGPTARRCLS